MELENQYLSIRWIHQINKRYYQIFLAKDLLGDWVITKSWGALNTSIGRVMHVACTSEENAKTLVKKISTTRKQRGYVFVENHR